MFGLTATASTTSLGLDLNLSRLTGEATQFKKPKAPAKKRPKAKFTCPTCKEGYVSEKYFEAHFMTHTMQG